MEVEFRSSADGVSIPVTRCDSSGNGPAMVILPAMGFRAARYEAFAESLAELGAPSVTVEMRGVGTSPFRVQRGHDASYRDLVDGEVASGVQAAADFWPGREVAIVGHSLGGHLGLIYAGLHPGQVAGLALTAAGSLHWRSFEGVRNRARILVGSQVAAASTALFGYYPGDRVGFGGRQPAGVIRDWAHLGRTGRLRAGGEEVDDAVATVSLPVLAISMARDLDAPASSAEAATAKVPNAQVTKEILTDGELGTRADHASWLKQPDVVAERLVEWAASALPGGSL